MKIAAAVDVAATAAAALAAFCWLLAVGAPLPLLPLLPLHFAFRLKMSSHKC